MEVVEYILKRRVTITRQATTLCKKERAAEKEVKGSEKKPMTYYKNMGCHKISERRPKLYKDTWSPHHTDPNKCGFTR